MKIYISIVFFRALVSAFKKFFTFIVNIENFVNFQKQYVSINGNIIYYEMKV